MKYGVMEYFRMHGTQAEYGLKSEGDRTKLFPLAKALGFHGVELGLGLDFREDPLWTGEGNTRSAIWEAAQHTGVEAASICLHLLNYKENSPASDVAGHREASRMIIVNTIEACTLIGASVILVPFFGTAALKSDEQKRLLVSEMKRMAPVAEENGVCLGLEVSMDAPELVSMVEDIGSDYVQVYFDIGNTASLKRDIVPEILGLGEHITQVHVKDYPSRTLGEGNIDYAKVVGALSEVGYDGYLMLETPSLGDSASAASNNLDYLRRVIEET